MQTLSSASRTCMASASAVECTATVAIPSSLQARSTRSAISPRLAIRILSNIYSIINHGRRRRDGGDRRHMGAHAREYLHHRLARDAHAHALALHLDLAEAGLVEQLRQLADQILFAHVPRFQGVQLFALAPISPASPV